MEFLEIVKTADKNDYYDPSVVENFAIIDN